MDCSAPPPLTDDQISEALDDRAGSEVLAHLAVCPACAAQLARARRIEAGLRRRLRRWDCPPPQMLADYHLGRVGGEEDRAIARHLALCASCKEEIESLRVFLLAEEPRPAAAAAPAPSKLPRATGGPLLARLVPRAGARALRGQATTSIQATAEATSIWLDLRPAGAGVVDVYGQVADDDLERWTGALIELRQAGALQATAEVDDLGAFGCGRVLAGTYELRLTPRMGRMVVIANLDLEPRV